ncbi:MAG: DUF1624 domain-containing protein [Bacilli bacterium]|nr:DUF1624 domain-containing protein [Bacilli bacterium]
MANQEATMEITRSRKHRIGPFEKRIHEIDFIRGVLIFLVVFDHIMNHFAFDNTFNQGLQQAAWWYWYCQPRQVIRMVALFGFCFVSGISCAFSRNNWLRAGQMLLIYGVLTVGSTIIEAWGLFPDMTMYIPFNIIGVLAWSTLFYCFVQNKSWRGILAMLLFSFLMCQYFIPWLQQVNQLKSVHPAAAALFKPNTDYADWLPLFPFMTFFMMGAFVSYFVYRDKKKSITKHKYQWERPVCFIGRHTLIIYALHQVVFIPIFMLLNLWL